MGIYDTYGKVQLKVGKVDMSSYSIGDKVSIPDGAYVGYEGVIIIKGGKFLAEFKQLEDKWGSVISTSELAGSLNPLNEVVDKVMKKKGEYKYLSWPGKMRVTNIMKEVEKYTEDSWVIISHSHSRYGMSIILRK
jgi:hypothetical protein